MARAATNRADVRPELARAGPPRTIGQHPRAVVLDGSVVRFDGVAGRTGIVVECLFPDTSTDDGNAPESHRPSDHPGWLNRVAELFQRRVLLSSLAR
jgi:hypothetical protein